MKNIIREKIEKEGCNTAAEIEPAVTKRGDYIPAEMTFVSLETDCLFLAGSVIKDYVTVTNYSPVLNAEEEDYFDLTF